MNYWLNNQIIGDWNKPIRKAIPLQNWISNGSKKTLNYNHMKHYIKLLGLSAVFLVASCKGEIQEERAGTEKIKKAAAMPILPGNIEKINFKIEGMTCAMGCAKMIEGKLENARGVDSAKVDFETKLAHVSFDKTQQSKEELENSIEALLDGTTYKVSEINE